MFQVGVQSDHSRDRRDVGYRGNYRGSGNFGADTRAKPPLNILWKNEDV